jgi:hypothetical protein
MMDRQEDFTVAFLDADHNKDARLPCIFRRKRAFWTFLALSASLARQTYALK